MEEFDRTYHYWSSAPGITSILTPGQSFGPGAVPGQGSVMAYLIEGTEKAILWDNGYGNGNIKKLAEQLTDKPVLAFNSHNHLDHNGCNSLFDEVYIGEHEDGIDQPVYVQDHIPGGPDPDVKAGGPYRWHLVKDGDVFDLGGRTITIIEVPGHTRGSICALDSQTKLLISGDAVLKRVFLTGAVTMSEFRKSLVRLKSFDFADILCGHYDRPIAREQVDRFIDLIDRFDERKLEKAEWPGTGRGMYVFRCGNSFDDPGFVAFSVPMDRKDETLK